MNKDSRILVAGSRGLVGSAIVRNLKDKGYFNIVEGTRDDVDFTNQENTYKYFSSMEPEYVFLAAAKVGGIMANKTHPAEFIYDNLMIQSNVINTSYDYGVKKLMFFASSCIYSKNCPMPIKEQELLTGELEKSNEFYAIAKIAGIKLCEAYQKEYGCNFISVNPCNIYGPENKIDLLKGHVMTSLIYKVWEAKKKNISFIECFGDGTPKREFLYCDDLADAAIFLMNKETDSLINIGTGIEHSIIDIVNIICDVIDYDGKVVWDTTKPNGAARRVLDVEKLNSLGWKPQISLKEGISKVVNYLNQIYV